MTRLAAFVRLGRLKFLAGGFVLYALGVAIAVHAGHPLDLRVVLIGQLFVTGAQLMTHYGNDYFDYEADRANETPTAWSGGSRVLPTGELPPRVALVTALVLAALAVAVAAWLTLALHRGALSAGLMALVVLLSWEYSAPPLRLCASGLGELDVAVVVTGLVPLLGFTLQTGELGVLPLLAIPPLACAQLAMLLCIELPDAAGDRASGKRTLVVRLGAPRAARLAIGVHALLYACLPVLVVAGLPRRVALGVALTAPLSAWQAWRLARGAGQDPGAWGALTTRAVALLGLVSLAELLAFLGGTILSGGGGASRGPGP